MTRMAHQIATRAIGGGVRISLVRDPADGSTRYAVAYTFGSAGTRWLCRHHFLEISQAEAGALTLADFLGAEYRS
jgi:hypothetical protein